MSSIKPFNAVYYNPQKIKDLTKVTCPPYDVISQEEQNHFYNISPYNFIHIALSREKPRDGKVHNKYARAKKTFESWIKRNILMKDSKPCIYFYKQDFKVMGQKYSRLGFISLMKLQDDEDSRIFPHENTHAQAIDDRLKLWRSLGANLSSIFVCYSDKQRKVEKIFNKRIFTTQPLIDIEDQDHVRHVLWRLEDEALIKEVNSSLEGQNVFIADGHHRYQVAREFRRAKKERKTNFHGEEPFNYVMTYFTNIDSKDLQIFPVHRVIKHLPENLDFLEEHFRIDKIKSKDDLMILLAKAGQNENAFGLYTRRDIRLLRLKSKLMIDEHIQDGSAEYKSLDATILKYFVLDKLGIASDDIAYTKDLKEAIDKVDNMEAAASFIMNPVKISQLKAIALNGEKMPPKTTYFYPKILSGLTVYKMDK